MRQWTPLLRYNINVIPIVEDSRILGYLSRQVAEKATFHGLKDLPVTEYMNSDFECVTPDAGVAEIQDRIVGENQRILPVVEDDKLVGIITRTDLLSMLVENPSIPQYLFDFPRRSGYVRKKNLASLMRERLSRNIIDALKSLGRVADDLEFNIYVVGGFVRDLLLRKQNLDIDVVVEGSGIDFALKYAESYADARVRTHKKFGTAVILFKNGFSIDVATARREVYESPAALPIVELSSIKLDLYRRDFTVNTLALQLNSRHFGTLIDFFGAQKDIKEKTIRVLHSLSFVEDPTRVFRAIRFEKRFGFKIGKLTQQLVDNARRIDVFRGLSGRRLFNEIRLMLSEQRPVLCIARMNEFELLPILHPGLEFNSELEDLLLRVDVVLNWYDLLYLENNYEKWKVHFLALADPLNPVEFEHLLKRLEVSKSMFNELSKAKYDAQDIPRRMPRQGELSRGEIYRLLEPVGIESLLFLMARTKRENLKKAVSTYFNRLKGTKLAVRGKDLRRLGYPPGPIYSKILDTLFMAKLNDGLQTREEELEYLKRVFPIAESSGNRVPE